MSNIEPKVLVAMGGNLPSAHGGPALTLISAVHALAAEVGVIRAVSRFFATPCFPAGAGPDYVNAAIWLETGLAPGPLLAALHKVEARFGRERQQRWGMRTLDLDLIAIGGQVAPDAATHAAWRALSPDAQRQEAPDQLILPHPRLQDRAFVLVPLNDIAPDWRHPVLDHTIAQMCDALPAADRAAVAAI